MAKNLKLPLSECSSLGAKFAGMEDTLTILKVNLTPPGRHDTGVLETGGLGGQHFS